MQLGVNITSVVRLGLCAAASSALAIGCAQRPSVGSAADPAARNASDDKCMTECVVSVQHEKSTEVVLRGTAGGLSTSSETTIPGCNRWSEVMGATGFSADSAWTLTTFELNASAAPPYELELTGAQHSLAVIDAIAYRGCRAFTDRDFDDEVELGFDAWRCRIDVAFVTADSATVELTVE